MPAVGRPWPSEDKDEDGDLYYEDDGYQAGKAFLCEPRDVADKEAAKKQSSTSSRLHLASVATSRMSMAASQSPIETRKERYSQPKPEQNW